MVAECALLGAGAVVASDAIKIEYLKSKHRELTDTEKREFLADDSRRFIHFTSETSAKKIMQSGFLIPTKGVVNNHFTRSMDSKGITRESEMVYMFDSATFSVDDYIRNLPIKRSPFNGCYEYYAISTKPNKYDIHDFRKRAQDGAITYEGRLDIDGTDTRLVKYALALDEQGEYTFTEMAMDAEYTPTPELLAKLERDKTTSIGYIAKTYMSEVRKSKESMRRFRAEKNIYKEQIRKKKELAKANRQFTEEEKDKSYIYEQDGRTIVVKNIEYEQVGGKRLQKIAIMEREDGTKKSKPSMTFCYMDELDVSKLEPEVASKYFFSNHDEARNSKSKMPRYIGMPLLNLETGEVVNEYDTTFDKDFREHMDRKYKVSAGLEERYERVKKSRGIVAKVKSMFARIFKKEQPLALSEAEVDRQRLADLGYSSVEAMNNDDRDARMFKLLEDGTYPPEEVATYDLTNESQETLTIKPREVEEK